MKRVLIVLVTGTIVSGVAAYAATARGDALAASAPPASASVAYKAMAVR